jgi:hypothetical protein
MGSQKKQAKDELWKIVQRSKVKNNLLSFLSVHLRSLLTKIIFTENSLRPYFP